MLVDGIGLELQYFQICLYSPVPAILSLDGKRAKLKVRIDSSLAWTDQMQPKVCRVNAIQSKNKVNNLVVQGLNSVIFSSSETTLNRNPRPLESGQKTKWKKKYEHIQRHRTPG